MRTEPSSGSAPEAGVEEFITRCHEALSQQSQGRPEPFLELWSHADDVRPARPLPLLEEQVACVCFRLER